ncbi:hypothetical protein D3C71_1838220 [compost metagenome]
MKLCSPLSTLTRWVIAPSTASEEESHNGVSPKLTSPLSTTCKVLPRAVPVSPLSGNAAIRLAPSTRPCCACALNVELTVVKLLSSGMFSR